MMGVRRWGGPAVLVAAIALGVAPGLRGLPEDPNPPAEGRDAPLPSRTPIADSVDRVVEEFIREHTCGTAGGVPCFPVTVEVRGRRYSVRQTLDNLELDGRPVPGALPLAHEMDQHSANPRPPSASVGVDPKTIACKARQLLRKIQGKSRRYYLYRVWDEAGERAVLRERPLDPEALGTSPHVSLGEFGDECEALKAYLRATHDIRFRRETADADADAERAEDRALELRSNPGPE